MPHLPFMTKADFVASRHSPKPEYLQEWRETVTNPPDPANCACYAEGFVIEKREDGFYPYSWWRNPNRHETLESAEGDLFYWRSEFLD